MADSSQQLEELLRDPGYLKTIDLLTREVMRTWNYSHSDAHRLVLSAIGEPRALSDIHEAWLVARAGGNSRLPALISRRRVLDLLGKDARRPGHSSALLGSEEIDAEWVPAALRTDANLAPSVQLERAELRAMIRGAIACFAAGGVVQQRQASLLQSRVFDEVSYPDLCLELACTRTALRVRVHAALRAFRRHILSCHPELVLTRPLSIRARNV